MDSVVNQNQDSSALENGDSDGSEHSVDSIHQRFQSDVFICVACRQTFEKKAKVKEHFKSGCGTICLSCQAPMYVRQSPFGVEHSHACRKGFKLIKTNPSVQPVPVNNNTNP